MPSDCWRNTNSRTLDLIDLATKGVMGQVPACGKQELNRAVAAARRAFKAWKPTPVRDRRTAIRAIASAIKDNAEELWRLLTAEQREPHHQLMAKLWGSRVG